MAYDGEKEEDRKNLFPYSLYCAFFVLILLYRNRGFREGTGRKAGDASNLQLGRIY